MKAVLQRASQANVRVDGVVVGQLKPQLDGVSGAGLVILLGVEQGDVDGDSTYLAQKAAQLRIFPDADGKMNLSVKDVGGSVLVISQFTLIADWRKGRRPGFSRAAAPAEGERLYLHFVEELRQAGLPVETGSFGAHMEVSLTNDGPVTILMESQLAQEKKT
jgi:D-tyrosyl-tRNA(Tyr) deacylase